MNSLGKLAPKLSNKSINPTPLGKQNVNYALNIFHESTSAGLKIYSQENGVALGTSNFIDIIRKIWNILNIRNKNKGFHKRENYSKPFKTKNDFRISELECIIKWLQEWASFDFDSNGKLSKETF